MLEFADDFEERALARLLSQDSARPRVKAYVAALAAGARLVEDLLYDVFYGLQLDLATGPELDRWGRIVGESRGGLLDADYSRWIEWRIRVHTTDATVPRMAALLEEIYPPQTIRFATMWPNGVQWWVEGGAFFDDIHKSHIDTLIRDYQPAGAAWPVIHVPTNPWTWTTVMDGATELLAELHFPGR